MLSQSARGHIVMLTFSALVAGSFSLGRMAAPFVDPAVLNAVRFVVAALALGVLALKSGAGREVFDAPWRYVILAGLYATYFVTMFEGLKTAPPVNMAAVFTLSPLMAAGFGWLVLRQRTTLRVLFALLLGGLGAVWVIFRADIQALFAFEIGRGEMIYVWGCAAHALFAPLLSKFSRGEPAVAFNAVMLVMGAVLLGFWGAHDIATTDWAALPRIVWITIGYTAIAATATTTLCLRYAAMRLPASKVLAYTYLVPSWVILWEIAVGHGAPPALVLPGVAVTCLALLLLLKD
ncbi:DMT family transporter [Allosediminivita pacifica]|uniref:Putative membrane protein n=1 Tax=Allosediminivita pacifica TaxID=1267769 RepID=A0A2T6API6_9RHOB|nr:EamA family transporter [Allosediminivita pacifica]PTX45733.1 putative membrane protein [Allosediminivita pacifica]GGB07489.1 multidrug DMT transporter [Allosediminivita pacifica]